jgi:hypothetical protein
MASDREIALHVQNMQNNGQDIPFPQIPGYREWAQKKLDEGESEAFIANLDTRCWFLLPEEVATIGADNFEELLEDLKWEVDKLSLRER